MERDQACDLCDDTGTMTWQQPVPGPGGALSLTEMTHPCVNGCAGWFKLPAADRGTVVDPGTADVGNVAVANLDHRTDWSRPALPTQDRPAPPL